MEQLHVLIRGLERSLGIKSLGKRAEISLLFCVLADFIELNSPKWRFPVLHILVFCTYRDGKPQSRAVCAVSSSHAMLLPDLFLMLPTDPKEKKQTNKRERNKQNQVLVMCIPKPGAF